MEIQKEHQRPIFPNPSLAAWLREQERTIVPAWISAVQRTTAEIRRSLSTLQLESAQLMGFFDSIVSAVKSGDVTDLDLAIEKLVQDRLGRGYSLTDFLEVANQLKTAILKSAREKLSPVRALNAILDLEPIFAHSTTRLAWLTHRTAEARLEEELERARYAVEKLDQSKSDFISIAAHELRTPLTLIQGYGALLANTLGQKEPQPDIERALKGLDAGTSRLESIIQDMIDVSLIDSEVLTLSFQKASLANIIQLAATDLQKEAGDRDLKLKIDSFPKEMEAVYIDSMRIYQAFTNVIGNAIKYTPDGGKINIDADLISDSEQPFQYVKIAIVDTGIGIAPEDLGHIFDKFYRVGEVELYSTSKTEFRGGGPGLGLAITKGVIEAHGGKIWVESPGCDEEACPGTSFFVMLPLYTEPPVLSSERLLGLEP